MGKKSGCSNTRWKSAYKRLCNKLSRVTDKKDLKRGVEPETAPNHKRYEPTDW